MYVLPVQLIMQSYCLDLRYTTKLSSSFNIKVGWRVVRWRGEE